MPKQQCSMLVEPATGGNPKLRPARNGVEPPHKHLVSFLCRNLDGREEVVVSGSQACPSEDKELQRGEVPA